MLRPVAPDDVPALRALRAHPAVRRWWGVEDDPGWPLSEEGVESWTIEVDGRVAGLIQAYEEPEPDYRHAGIDIYVDPALSGRGLGTDAVRTLAGHLVHDRGHHRLIIDPAAANAPAIRAYEKVGFRPVGVMRAYERDPDGGGWHDGLLMDLLAEELDAGRDG